MYQRGERVEKTRKKRKNAIVKIPDSCPVAIVLCIQQDGEFHCSLWPSCVLSIPPCAPVRCCLLSGYRTKCQILSIVWTLFLSIIFLVLMPKEVSSVELAGRRRGALQAVNLPTVQTIISNHIGFCGYVNVSWIMGCSGA